MKERKTKDRKEIIKKIRLSLVFGAVFFIVSMPFKMIFQISDVTEIRPASVLPIVFGLCYGFYGALGAALGNLIADICSGYAMPLCFTGFIIQFLYGYIPYRLWYIGKDKKQKVSFKKVKDIEKYIKIVVLDCSFTAVFLGCLMQFFHIHSLFSVTTLLLLLNNLVFGLTAGIPLIILNNKIKDKERERTFTLNERIVILFILLSLLVAFLTGICLYLECSRYMEAVTLWNSIFIYISFVIFVLNFVVILILHYLESHITMPVEQMTFAANSYLKQEEHTQGTKYLLEVCKPYKSLKSEIGILAHAISQMAVNIEDYISNLMMVTSEKERIKTELDVAAKIQESFLIKQFPAFPEKKELDIYAVMKPAKEVGGDFYDFFLTSSQEEKKEYLWILIADVSGKGVPAALFMTKAKTVIRKYAETMQEPGKALSCANQELSVGNNEGFFVTAFLCRYDVETGELLYVNAGHNPPLLNRRTEKRYEWLKGSGEIVLGVIESYSYCSVKSFMKRGDLLYLYTDGVTEAENLENQLYGTDRLLDTLKNCQENNPRKLVEAVYEEVKKYTGEAAQSDDITMLAFTHRYLNYGAADLSRITEVLEFTEKSFLALGGKENLTYRVSVIVDEWFSNICNYSHAANVTMECCVKEGEIVIIIQDDGILYNPLKSQVPDVSQNIKERMPGGLGIYIMKHFAKNITYTRKGERNHLEIVVSK